MSAGRDYQKLAGDLLFGGDTLDNAARGLFLEAVIFHALLQHDRGLGLAPRWLHAGAGWGPWDLQRGSAVQGDRVRVQLKVKAARQLWTTSKQRRLAFDLGWKKARKDRSQLGLDSPDDIYGTYEPEGHRCDLFLFAWHGPHPGLGEMRRGERQSDPHNYDLFIMPRSARVDAKSIPVHTLFAECPPLNLEELPSILNRAADQFLAAQQPLDDRAGTPTA